MSQIAVDKNLCKKDGACIKVCPAGVLAADTEGFPAEIPDSHCILCGHCVAVCPTGALTHSGLPAEPALPAAKNWPSPEAMDGFLMSRRSVREFKDKPVAKEVLESLLDIARRAPTAANSQLLRWIVVEGKQKLHTIAEEIVEGMRASGVNPAFLKQWEGGYDFVMRGASTLVVAIAPADYTWRREDSAIALTYFELAAEARGLGVCWAGYLTRCATLYAPLRQLLAVPEGFVVCGALMLGEGTYRYRQVPPRKPLSVQWN
jgi:nitroreductase/NAD-dependent dihydropyrimidine dehydrogenase PreA subunit